MDENGNVLFLKLVVVVVVVVVFIWWPCMFLKSWMWS